MQPRYLNATDMIYILLFSWEAIKGKLYFMFLFIELIFAVVMHKAIAHFAFEFLGKDTLCFSKLLQFQLI